MKRTPFLITALQTITAISILPNRYILSPSFSFFIRRLIPPILYHRVLAKTMNYGSFFGALFFTFFMVPKYHTEFPKNLIIHRHIHPVPRFMFEQGFPHRGLYVNFLSFQIFCTKKANTPIFIDILAPCTLLHKFSLLNQKVFRKPPIILGLALTHHWQ